MNLFYGNGIRKSSMNAGCFSPQNRKRPSLAQQKLLCTEVSKFLFRRVSILFIKFKDSSPMVLKFQKLRVQRHNDLILFWFICHVYFCKLVQLQTLLSQTSQIKQFSANVSTTFHPILTFVLFPKESTLVHQVVFHHLD